MKNNLKITKFIFIITLSLTFLGFAKLSFAVDFNVSREDVIMPQGVDSVYLFNGLDSSFIVKFKNTIDYSLDSSVRDNTSYIFRNSDGSILNGSNIGCNSIGDNGQLKTGYGRISMYAYSGGGSIGVDNYNAVVINPSCAFPSGSYKMCVKNVRTTAFYSTSPGVLQNDPMEETCVDFDTSDKIIGAYPNQTTSIYVDTNFTPALSNNKNYDNASNYVFKDSYGNVLDGSNISCYGNPGSHPNIDSSGHPTGSISSDMVINLGCSLPLGQYQLCVSNINDIRNGSMNGTQCVPLSDYPRVVSARHIPGSRNKIELVLDNKFSSVIDGAKVTIKYSNGAVLNSYDSKAIDDFGHPINGFNSSGNFIYINLAVSPNGNVSYRDPVSYYRSILYPATYQVCLSGVKYIFDDSISSPEQCINVEIKDYTRPFLNVFSIGFSYNNNYSASRNKIIIKYSESMGNGSYGYGALDRNNYMIKDFDTDGNGTVDTTTWTRLSDHIFDGVSMYFSNNDEYVNISLPTNSSIGFVDRETDVMIGDQTDPNHHLIKDTAGNSFVDVGTGYGYMIGQNLLVNKKLDISSLSDVKSVEIKSPTEIDFEFKRYISSISASDFIIKNTANSSGFTPISATIDDNDNHIVKFIVPDVVSKKFTENDSSQNRRNVQLITNDSVTSSYDDSGLSFLESSVFNAYMDVIFINDLVAPEIKAIKFAPYYYDYYPNNIMLELSGKVTTADQFDSNPFSLKSLGDSIIISQGSDIVSSYGVSMEDFYTHSIGNKVLLSIPSSGDNDYNVSAVNNNSNFFYNELTGNTILYGMFNLITKNLRNTTLTVKTKPSSSISFTNLSGKTLKENTVGVSSNFNDFFVIGIRANFIYDYGYNINSGSLINIGFNKNVDKSSIISDTPWKRYYDISKYDDGLVGAASRIGCGNGYGYGICYVQAIPNGISFDGVSNKILFPGTNIGYLYCSDNMKVSGLSSVAFSNLYVVFNESTNDLILYVADNVDVEFNPGDKIYYIPDSNIKTKSGIYIDTDFDMDSWMQIASPSN